MKSLQRLGLASGLLTGLLGTGAHQQWTGADLGFVSSARAQQPQSEEEKKRQQHKQNQQNQQKPPPPPQQPRVQTPPPPPRANNQQPPPRREGPPQGVPSNPNANQQPRFKEFKKDFGQQPNNPSANQPNNPQPQLKKNFGQQPPPTPLPPPAVQQQPQQPQFKQVNPQFLPKGVPGPKEGVPGNQPNVANPTGPGQGTSPRFLPKGQTNVPPTGITKGPTGPGQGPTTFLPKRLDEVQGSRKQRVEGNRTIITEPGNRTIIKQDNRIVIRHDETDRFRFGARDVRTTRGPGGTTQTFFLRPDGSRVVTETDASGRILRRYRRDRSGREISIIDNRRFYRNVAIGVGVGILGAAILLNLPRPVVDIPRERYIVDYDRASDDDLYEALTAPPLVRMERAYSLEEIRDNYPLRERMRSIDLDNVTFESGSFEITPEQYPLLERMARIINRILERRPEEVFLIEGHTDATGSAEDNLSLSDRRAQAVAQVLSESFGVPPENLVTQGYGEQFLKIDTQGPERANRRVTVRRISPLMAEAQRDRP